ncbi:MAG: endonuclease V [Candidatus Micrarchaeia archaeon]
MPSRLARLVRVQETLAKRVILKNNYGKLELVGGADAAYARGKIVAAAVVCDASTLRPVEQARVILHHVFPYIPGFLAFREGPAIVAAVRKLRHKPDLLLINGHGICHPRGCGLASHVGLQLKMPTIGVAQGLLKGTVERRGKLFVGKRFVGYALRRASFAPIFISPGHRVSLASSARLVRRFLREHRLPEPLFHAHVLAERTKRAIWPVSFS